MVGALKVCSKCGEEKLVELFSKDRSRDDGRSSRCRECKRIYSAGYREKNRDKLLAYGRKPGVIAMQAEYHKEYRQTDRFREIQAVSRIKNLHECKSRAKLNYAIKTGRITRGPCEICGTTENIHAHHHDYSKPLDVVWLCIAHHKALHADIRNEQMINNKIGKGESSEAD